MNDNQTIVVTGGSVGIGLAICTQLLDEGYTVINLSRRAAELEHPQLHNRVVDLSVAEDVERVASQVAQNFNISGFVHNAGLIRPNLLEDVDLNDLTYLTQVHIGAAISLTQAFLPKMKAAQYGRIVLITSRAALGLQTRTSYSATKSGMMGMARTWALELGPHGITVNTVAPGPIEATEMFDAVIEDGSEKKKALAASIPVKRIGLPTDVANAVYFFIQPGNGFVTGQTLMVCGGSSLGAINL